MVMFPEKIDLSRNIFVSFEPIFAYKLCFQGWENCGILNEISKFSNVLATSVSWFSLSQRKL